MFTHASDEYNFYQASSSPPPPPPQSASSSASQHYPPDGQESTNVLDQSQELKQFQFQNYQALPPPAPPYPVANYDEYTTAPTSYYNWTPDPSPWPPMAAYEQEKPGSYLPQMMSIYDPTPPPPPPVRTEEGGEPTTEGRLNPICEDPLDAASLKSTQASGFPIPAIVGGFTQPNMAEYHVDGETKPPFSYITLIVSAMMASSEKKVTLSEIYAWIMYHFAYYRKNTKR